MLNQNLDIYSTGSNANMFSSDIANHLSGRFIEINVQILSYLEFLDFYSFSDKENALELFIKYGGGLPCLRNLPLNDEVVLNI